MKSVVTALLFLVMLSFSSANNSGEDVLAKMYKQYAGKWMSSFSFTQTTQQYRNDSLVNTSTWYEHIVFPDKFRIDFGDIKSGNAAIFTKDSIYVFRKSLLARTTANDENLTFMLGGMYFYPFDTVKAMYKHYGYDIGKSYETTFNNAPVYVIGANNADEKTSQLWIDKEKLVVVKFISFAKGEKEEGIFKDHKQFGNSWSEMACDFYVNGKLIQKETYYDCKANADIDPKIFDYKNFTEPQ
jgi:outer membrane lipoprotein-sorting protein